MTTNTRKQDCETTHDGTFCIYCGHLMYDELFPSEESKEGQSLVKRHANAIKRAFGKRLTKSKAKEGE